MLEWYYTFFQHFQILSMSIYIIYNAQIHVHILISDKNIPESEAIPFAVY